MELLQLLHCGLNEILKRLLALHSSSNFTLNLGNLSAQDTLQLLYAGSGMFTYVDACNLKDANRCMDTGGKGTTTVLKREANQVENSDLHYNLISKLQNAFNDENVISLKNVIRDIILDHDKHQRILQNGMQTMTKQTITKDKKKSVSCWGSWCAGYIRYSSKMGCDHLKICIILCCCSY